MQEIAILIAAGKGQRMRPVTLKKPKPLVTVKGRPMAETVIEGLISRGVQKIFVVTGYLGDQFSYLPQKYKQVELIKNTEYERKNNISSLYAARHVLGGADCFVCEADLFVSDPALFSGEFKNSCYFGKLVKGYSSDWLFTEDNGRIVKIGKGGEDKYNMCGVSFFKAKDIKLVAEAVEEAYKTPAHADMFWDEIVDACLDKIYLTVHPINPSMIVEIDTVEELKSVDPTTPDLPA